MLIGFTKVYVDEEGYPTDEESVWIGDAFVVFGYVIYIGKIRRAGDE
jgi:hypothetical protein